MGCDNTDSFKRLPMERIHCNTVTLLVPIISAMLRKLNPLRKSNKA
jgi:hypothetical protein